MNGHRSTSAAVSKQLYFLARAVGGNFGTGTGEEGPGGRGLRKAMDAVNHRDIGTADDLAQLASVGRSVAEVVAEVLKEGQCAGLFRRHDAVSTAHALLAATNSLLPYSLSTTELGERDEVMEKATVVADLILRGLLERSHRD